MKTQKVISVIVFIFAAFVIFAPPAHAIPEGFTKSLVTAGLSLPTDFAFTPDGRALITLKNGKVVIFKNNELLSTPALTKAMSTGGDRGLLSIALDPNFGNSNYVYLLYTSTANRQRISRFTISGDIIDPASEIILLENPRAWNGFLNAGALRFGPDGKLYASFGSNGMGMVAQDLSALEGKLVRINADGSIPSDNPFANTPGAQRSIYSYGFRNPWRFEFDQSGRAIIGDVGEMAYEKIVRAFPGANYGWPTVEGDCRPNCNGITPPLFVMPHTNSEGSAVVGGPVYASSGFPPQYFNAYFFGDYVRGTLNYVSLDSQGNAGPIQVFDADAGVLSGIRTGPNGCLYYLTIFPGEFHKICYGSAAQLVAQASSDKTYGTLPLTVAFSSASTKNPDGTALTYHWDFGDGATSTEPNPSHTYTVKGVYTVRLTTQTNGKSSSATMTMWAGYLPPEATITSPNIGRTYSTGDTIAYSGTANDPQEGSLPPNAYVWQIYFHHNTHVHSPIEEIGTTGGTLVIEPHEESAPDTWYEFVLTVTNNVGLSTVVKREIRPNIITLKLDTDPGGLQLLLNDQPVTAPLSVQHVAKSPQKISVQSPQSNNGTTRTFSRWSDGGAQAHTVTPDASMTYTAFFTTSSASLPTQFIVQAAPDKDSYAGSAPATLTATVTSPTTIPDALIDIELWGTEKLAQFFQTTSLTAGQPRSLTWQTTAPATPGAYTAKVGVFASNWSRLYHWSDGAARLNVTQPSSTPAFVVSAAMPKQTFTGGETATITTNITATADIPDVKIHTEVYDAQNVQIAQKIIGTSLRTNQMFSDAWNLAVPQANGKYTVKVGVFPSDYSKLYFWKNNAFEFMIGTPPGGPQPGMTYVPSIMVPQDGGTVSGLVEIKAAIPELDINSYNLGWRTGTGSYFEMDVEPVDQNYKHAWIDFGPWNWMPDNIYPLDFRATDENGNVIGSKTIRVKVQH